MLKRNLSLICVAVVCAVATSAYGGITKKEGQRLMNGEDLTTIRQDEHEQQQKKQDEQNKQKEDGGNSCITDADCQMATQFCRKVNYKAKGICVEKAQ